ncbi:hypothetical protein ABZ401_19100 [Streptomyces sp. NPDC005892]|uniref:hypothetical protein n=1 Tax=Streptomyces sp. NPDC005892 TaxID=3155593 RepID=UPI0034109F27
MTARPPRVLAAITTTAGRVWECDRCRRAWRPDTPEELLVEHEETCQTNTIEKEPALPEQPEQPEPIVTTVRHEVSIFPVGDINRKYFTLRVDQTRRGTWVVTNGTYGYGGDDRWHFGYDSGAEYDNPDDAIALARRLAPDLKVNGATATEVYNRTRAA